MDILVKKQGKGCLTSAEEALITYWRDVQASQVLGRVQSVPLLARKHKTIKTNLQDGLRVFNRRILVLGDGAGHVMGRAEGEDKGQRKKDA